MRCPRHSAEFHWSTVDGHDLHRCPECAGLWIAGAHVDSLLGQGERLKLRSLCSARQSELVCPCDGKKLGEATIAGVTLDLCLECNGLWLDWGELERLRERAKLPPSQISSGRLSPGKTAADRAWDAAATVDIVVNGILALLTW